ncbi:MAG: SPOR domain-containing protein [Gammaproteobacteria bacterium]
MNEAVKQRLVGGITLFVLGVIIIPLILDGPPPGRFEEVRMSQPEQAGGDDVVSFRPPPPPAKVAIARDDAPSNAQRSAPLTPPAPAKVKVAPEKNTAKPAPPKVVKSEQASGSWIVQVGVFSSQANASGLVKRMKAKGFSAYMNELTGKKGTVYRVSVGPLTSRTEADRARGNIQAIFGMKGLVRKRS